MSTKIMITRHDNGNIVCDIYVNEKWFSQVIPEGEVNIAQVLDCVGDMLQNAEDYAMP